MTRNMSTRDMVIRILRNLKLILRIEYLSVSIGIIGIILTLIALPQVNRIFETDPRIRLNDLGYDWSRQGLMTAFDTGDLDSFKLFAEGGMELGIYFNEEAIQAIDHVNGNAVPKYDDDWLDFLIDKNRHSGCSIEDIYTEIDDSEKNWIDFLAENRVRAQFFKDICDPKGKWFTGRDRGYSLMRSDPGRNFNPWRTPGERETGQVNAARRIAFLDTLLSR